MNSIKHIWQYQNSVAVPLIINIDLRPALHEILRKLNLAPAVLGFHVEEDTIRAYVRVKPKLNRHEEITFWGYDFTISKAEHMAIIRVIDYLKVLYNFTINDFNCQYVQFYKYHANQLYAANEDLKHRNAMMKEFINQNIHP